MNSLHSCNRELFLPERTGFFRDTRSFVVAGVASRLSQQGCRIGNSERIENEVALDPAPPVRRSKSLAGLFPSDAYVFAGLR